MTNLMDEEEKEKAAAVSHVTTAAFPAVHLAPWMGVHDNRKAWAVAGLRAVARIGSELDRRAWKDSNPGKELPEKMKDEREPDPEWVWTEARGAVAMYGYGLRVLAEEMHDISPSVGGLGRKQAILIATAQKTGLNAAALEPQKRSIADRIRGKNKPSELAGMS